MRKTLKIAHIETSCDEGTSAAKLASMRETQLEIEYKKQYLCGAKLDDNNFNKSFPASSNFLSLYNL